MSLVLQIALNLFLCCADGYHIANTIECIETEYDFKAVSRSDIPISHVFILKNISKGDIFIQYACTTCHCLSVEWNNNIVKSGEQTSVIVTYRDSNYLGAFNKSAILYISGLKNPISLRVKGIIRE